jgi:hypothetical protein
VRVLGPARLVDALGQWGLHAAEGRVLAHLSVETRAALQGPERLLTRVDIALQYRDPLPYSPTRSSIRAAREVIDRSFAHPTVVADRGPRRRPKGDPRR